MSRSGRPAKAAFAAPALQEEEQETAGSWAHDMPLLLQNGLANMPSFKREDKRYARGDGHGAVVQFCIDVRY